MDYFDLPPINDDDSAKMGSEDYAILQWCDERLRRGIKFVESQVGYDKIATALKEIFSYEQSTTSSYVPTSKSLSDTRANLIAKVAEDLTAMLTDTRCFWNYTTNNPRFENQCRLANKTAARWYSDRLVDLRIGDVIRYWTIAGTGFAHVYYSRKIDDIILEAEDPRNVYPIDPLSYHSIQDCTGVITRRPRTPEWCREEFGKNVSPDTGGERGGFFGWLSRVVEGPGERNGPLSKRSQSDQAIPQTPTVFVNTMYLRDKRKNKTNDVKKVGKWDGDTPETPWSYEVKPGGYYYPFNRMIVWANQVLLYDGPAPYWHAKFPLIKFTLNPWPNSWFGKAPLWDCIPLNKSINSNLRVIDDHAAQVAQPALIADRNVSKAEVNKINTRLPGMKVRTNMASGKGISIQPPPPLDQIIWETIKWCEDKMKVLAGTMDPSSMVSLGQIPSDDTIDTIMKAMTPGVRLRSRILEGCYKELAEMFLYCMMEFDTLTKRIAEFGPQAVTAEDYDFDPHTMIPDDVPDGDPADPAASLSALGTNNPRPIYDRARMMLASFEYKFDPSSLLNTAAQQDLMKFFLLAKMGYISVFTLMEKMGIMNFAPPDLKIPPDEISRLQLQQKLGIGMIANSQGRKATDSAPPSVGQSGGGPIIQTS